MKKPFALALVLVMALSLCACGGNTTDGSTKAPESTPAQTQASSQAQTQAQTEAQTEAQTTVAPVADVKVAMITDYGDITDQSFNQTTYEACKEYADANGLTFKYFKPVTNADEDRVSMIEAAIDEGFNVIVMPGYAFGPAIVQTTPEYPDVTFIALDVSQGDLGDFKLLPNTYCAVYQEELCGYMAGYAAVKLGYTKLGFLGGMAVPAVVRYGYGFVQGCDAAAKELGKSDVEVKYCYGGQFYGDADITAAMDTWYQGGTEVVFACGGGIYTSACEAAQKVNAKVIGVDVDQDATITSQYAAGMTVTSAMKGLAATVKTMLQVVVDGKFADYGGKVDNLGLVSDVPEENYVQIAPSTQYAEGKFTANDYAQLVKDMHAGKVTVSNPIDVTADSLATVITVVDQGNLK
jgi:basic membrane protein A